MLFSLVWILAGITLWCVAALAVALTVGPVLRENDRVRRRPAPRRPTTHTGAIRIVQLQR